MNTNLSSQIQRSQHLGRSDDAELLLEGSQATFN